ncbi:probable methyltransferase PMT28 isoform X1 [Tanacetum coccineum]
MESGFLKPTNNHDAQAVDPLGIASKVKDIEGKKEGRKAVREGSRADDAALPFVISNFWPKLCVWGGMPLISISKKLEYENGKSGGILLKSFLGKCVAEIVELRNEECVRGCSGILLCPALRRAEIKKVPVWVKLYNVPIVAYSEVGLSLITTQIGKPIQLDAYTSDMCLNSWGRSAYARALIEISADVILKEDLVIVIPIRKDKGYSLATIHIEYEWRPPRCSTCLIFDHMDDKCPKLPKVVSHDVVTNVGVNHSKDVADDGFEVVKKKQNKKKKHQKQVDGVVLSKPSLNLHYVGDKGNY